MIEWEYPSDGKIPRLDIWDLSDRNAVMALYLALANGVVVEMKAEGDSVEALDVLRGLLQGAGSCSPVTLSTEQKKALWLYKDGYECYQQGITLPAFFFVYPTPRPDTF